jgi:hypothetical protein
VTGSLAYTQSLHSVVSLHKGSLPLDAAWLFAGFLALLVLAAGFIAARRFLLERGGGTVECGLRKGTGSWRLGVVSYQQDELHWFSAFGITSRADEAFRRRDLAVVSRRDPDPGEEATLGPDRVIVECSLANGETVELALASSALTGLLAWLEAAPPGQHLYPLTLLTLAARLASLRSPGRGGP